MTSDTNYYKTLHLNTTQNVQSVINENQPGSSIQQRDQPRVSVCAADHRALSVRALLSCAPPLVAARNSYHQASTLQIPPHTCEKSNAFNHQ